MSKQMLIDAARPEETRVVIASGSVLEDYDVALASHPQIKGNIYLAKVVRVEASLQAAFVDYGNEKHGFLSFTEIHPDYFQIPVADREAIAARDRELARQAAEAEELDLDGEELDAEDGADSEDVADEEDGQLADGERQGGPSSRRVSRRRSERQRRAELYRNYRIQEVIRNGQLILVQATKERRGSKGAVFSSYISLPGRYTVLMPNTAHSGGVSRKIGGPKDRKRLREIVRDLDVADGMSVILRTVAKGRTRAEIRRDFDYVASVWSEIREKTLNSVGASLVHKENDLVKRAVRDLFQSDVSEVIVAGEGAYRRAKEMTKILSPSKARHVKMYRGDLPFFHSFGIERPLASVHRPEVRLPSGGSMVIAQTEALVTVDINSGRAIRERHIEETALNTNLEAVDELARQLRLRDLAGLIVIDFIGMERRRNNEQVEQRLKEILKRDRARTHVGRMSEFGLIEMSRQRLRASIHDTQHESCVHCRGHGWTYRPEALALMVLRALECEVADHRGCRFRARVSPACARYLSEVLWRSLHQLETQFAVRVDIQTATAPLVDDFQLEVIRADGTAVALHPSGGADPDSGPARPGERSRRGARTRGASRENGVDRPARSRRPQPPETEDEGRGEGAGRRARGRTGPGSDRGGEDDGARPRNGRRPAVREAFDEGAGEEVPERRARSRRPQPPEVEDEGRGEGAGRRARGRTGPGSDRGGEDDGARPRNGRRPAGREAFDEGAGEEVPERRARSRRPQPPEVEDEGRGEGAGRRARGRTGPGSDRGGEDDGARPRNGRRPAGREAFDEGAGEEVPERRARSRRSQPPEVEDEGRGAGAGRRGRGRTGSGSDRGGEDDGARPRNGRRRPAGREAFDEEAGEEVPERRARSRRPQPPEVEDEGRGAGAGRRGRGRTGPGSDRGGEDDGARPRNGRRWPAGREAFDEEAGEEVPERRVHSRRSQFPEAEDEGRDEDGRRRAHGRNGPGPDRGGEDDGARPRNGHRRPAVRGVFDEETEDADRKVAERRSPSPDSPEGFDDDRHEGHRSRRARPGFRDDRRDAPGDRTGLRGRRRTSPRDEFGSIDDEDRPRPNRRPSDEDREAGPRGRGGARRARHTDRDGFEDAGAGGEIRPHRPARAPRLGGLDDQAPGRVPARRAGEPRSSRAGSDDAFPEDPHPRQRARPSVRDDLFPRALPEPRSDRARVEPVDDPEAGESGRLDESRGGFAGGGGLRDGVGASAESPFEEPAGIPPSGRRRRSERRTRRGSRGGIRRTGSRAGRRDSEASGREGAPGAAGDGARVDPAEPPPFGRSFERTGAVRNPDPFGSVVDRPGEPTAGGDEAFGAGRPGGRADEQVDAGRSSGGSPDRSESSPVFEDPFAAADARSAPPGSAGRRGGDAANRENPFTDPESAPRTGGADEANGNGAAGRSSGGEAGPEGRRRWRPFWSRS